VKRRVRAGAACWPETPIWFLDAELCARLVRHAGHATVHWETAEIRRIPAGDHDLVLIGAWADA
jgi:hypothetical protein